MDESMMNKDNMLCDGCGKPPRYDTDRNVMIPLKQCSRCRSSWYHDSVCQKLHYKVHKLTCSHPTNRSSTKEAKAVAVVSPNNVSTGSNCRNEQAKSMYTVRQRSDGEYGLFACQTIEPIYDGWDPSTITCRPLAPPILMKTHRTSNCALCFRSMAGIRKPISVSNNPRYPVLLCSEECRAQSEAWLPQETRIIQDMLDVDGNMIVLSVAVLVYRLLKEVPPEVYMEMRAHPKLLNHSSLHNEEAIHKELVTYMVTTMIQRTPYDASNRICVQQREHGWSHVTQAIHDVLLRDKFNGFTVVDHDSTIPEAIGIGLFSGPSYRINHSCRPNAGQTFAFAKGQSPQLEIEIFRQVPMHDEIYIRYIDDATHSTVQQRRQQLLQSYNFYCRCSQCLAEE